MPRSYNFKYEDRFLRNVLIEKSGCWAWTGSILGNGYGRIWHKNKAKLVHRFSYEWHVGPIPPSLQIDHLCRNRACCNPAHLEAVTGRVNVLRGNTITAANSVKTHCKRGHELAGANVYLNAGHRVCRECQKMHQKVSRDTDEYRAKHAAYERERRHRKEAADAMAERASMLDKRADSLRQYLLLQFQFMGKTRVERGPFALVLKNNPQSVVIDDEAALPAVYMIQPPAPPPTPDKRAIGAAIKLGVEVPGCHAEVSQRVDIVL